MDRTLFILGGTGFIGHETIIQAGKAEWQVKALARSEDGAKKMRQLGVQPVKGSAHVVGKGTNRPSLVHVTDAARAIVYLAGLSRNALVDHQFIAMDGAGTTQRELLNATAMYMGVKKPPTILLDAQVDNSSLQETGFHFLYPSYREGVPATLTELGYVPAKVKLA